MFLFLETFYASGLLLLHKKDRPQGSSLFPLHPGATVGKETFSPLRSSSLCLPFSSFCNFNKPAFSPKGCLFQIHSGNCVSQFCS